MEEGSVLILMKPSADMEENQTMFADCNILERNPLVGVSVMIWAAIGIGQCLGPVFFFQNTGTDRGIGETLHHLSLAASHCSIFGQASKHNVQTR